MRTLLLPIAAAPLLLAVFVLEKTEPGPRPQTAHQSAPQAPERAPPAKGERSPGEASRPFTVVPRSVWDPMEARRSSMHAYAGDLHKTFTHVVVHHSDFAPPPGPAAILSYHLYEAGFADIGYHFVVAHDGTIYEGRDLRFMGAHAGVSQEQRGGGPTKDPDFGAIGVVLDGNFVFAPPPDVQRVAALELVDDLRRRFAIPVDHVIGHREVKRHLVEDRGHALRSTPTDCPGDQLLSEVEIYRTSESYGFGMRRISPRAGSAQ